MLYVMYATNQRNWSLELYQHIGAMALHAIKLATDDCNGKPINLANSAICKKL